ncbi:MAG: TraR/DksA C4-type zinc finger protein [Syntrophales bacterium]|jgi:DnaK suppressor protein|nr:TraR/DksA C4-type zinc finger protein [Syntrophales bacterium]
MGKQQLRIIKRRLAERVRALQDSIDRSIHCLKKGNDPLPDPYDLASSESETSRELAIRERDRFLLLSFREALGRIEKGAYGSCERCGGAIALKRLMANPATTVCIGCKTEEESMVRRGEAPNPSDWSDTLQSRNEREGNRTR